MAKKVTILDDLDQTEGAETRSFIIGGRVYEVDLTDVNQAKMEKAVERFIKVARDITPVPRQPANDAYSDVDQGLVRDWAVAERLEVNPKGRVPLDLVYKYKRAMAAKEESDEDPKAETAELKAV